MDPVLLAKAVNRLPDNPAGELRVRRLRVLVANEIASYVAGRFELVRDRLRVKICTIQQGQTANPLNESRLRSDVRRKVTQ
jgi:hypothetical protein